MIVSVLSFLLGAVFLVAGIGKMFGIGLFAGTIASMTHVSPGAAHVLAIGLVSTELLGAIALLVNYRTQVVSLAFCILVTCFIWILSTTILQGKEIPCNCFGIVRIGLSNAQEFLLDIILFNAFALLAYGSRKKRLLLGKSDQRPRFPLPLVFALVVLFLEVYLTVAVIAQGHGVRRLHPKTAIEFGEQSDSQFAQWKSGNRALLLLSYGDLNCPLCFDDLMALADSLKAGLKRGDRHRVVALFKRDGFIQADSSSHLRRWCAANEFPFPVVVAPDTLFSAMNIPKSMLVVVDGKNEVLFADVFPMGEVKRGEALQRLVSADN
jgi:hypothetical protein